MKNKKLFFILIILIFGLGLFSNGQIGFAVTYYPYSVKIGDKIDYHMDTLVNGTNKGPINVYGLNLSQGDNFQIEIFTGVAKSTNYVGSDYSIKFIKGDQESNAISGASYLYTSNKTYWDEFKNTTSDIGGKVYELTRVNNSITYSWTSNADNFITIKFNPNDGIITSYERKTTSGPYNYTHIKFTKGSGNLLSNIPGFELPTGLIALVFIGIIAFQLKKKRI